MWLDGVFGQIVVAQVQFAYSTVFFKVTKLPFCDLIVLKLKVVQMLDWAKNGHRNFNDAVVAQVEIGYVFQVFETTGLEMSKN